MADQGAHVFALRARMAHRVSNCNYRRDLALSLDAVGRRTTSDRLLTCALPRHPDVHPGCTGWQGGAQEIPNPKPRIPNPNAVEPQTRRGSKGNFESPVSESPGPVFGTCDLDLNRDFDLGFGIWGLGFGVWDLGFTEATGRAVATNREPSGNPDRHRPPVASTPANGPSGAGASAREPGRNRAPMAASGPAASSGRCGRHARRNPTAIVGRGR